MKPIMVPIAMCVGIVLSNQIQAQDGTKDMEEYSRKHVAFTNFNRLGVSPRQYARTLESVNLTDAALTHKMIIVNGITYCDDGKNYDLVGSDGVLTSTTLFSYRAGDRPLASREYGTIVDNRMIADPSFSAGRDKTGSSLLERVAVLCIPIWVPCSSWPPSSQSYCYRISWPFNGSFELKCHYLND